MGGSSIARLVPTARCCVNPKPITSAGITSTPPPMPSNPLDTPTLKPTTNSPMIVNNPMARRSLRELTDSRDGMRAPEALGLPPWARLRLLEPPLALPSILAGVKTAAVIDVGTATLGAMVGAGGYGQPILRGIRLDSTPTIMEGARQRG